MTILFLLKDVTFRLYRQSWCCELANRLWLKTATTKKEARFQHVPGSGLDFLKCYYKEDVDIVHTCHPNTCKVNPAHRNTQPCSIMVLKVHTKKLQKSQKVKSYHLFAKTNSIIIYSHVCDRV